MLRAAFVGLLALVLAGCGPAGTGRYGLSGTVSFRGKPVEKGTIRFVSESPSGESAGAGIEAGRYDVPASHGLPPGRYKVVISSPVRPKTAPADKEYMGLYDELLPATANTATILVVEVTREGPNTFDFPVE